LQTCDVDGEWGPCAEEAHHDVCSVIDGWYSPAFEECLIENDECARDMWDLDNDGDDWESLGTCPPLLCFEEL
jgi:hypothetical protein